MKKSFASVALCLAAMSVSAAEYPAVLAWTQRVVLSTPVSGVVIAVPAVAGERVREGQVLVQLDKRPFESALRKAEAQAHKYRLNREEAERELQRTRELYERTVISVHDLQVGEIAFANAEADYASARAQLETARLQLEYAIVQAPFAGLVLEVAVAPGETVVNTQQATPMVTLARDRPMTAHAPVPAEAAGNLSPGQSATVTVDGQAYPARVVQLGAEADASGRYDLSVSFDPGDTALRAGLPALINTGR
ncbi:MAG: efflux RND transporter periplasmic adaptor subunit [Gammaproteobacteria bacterium]